VVWTDFTAAAGTDDIGDTISYVDLVDIAVDTVAGPSFDLIETLAAAIADRINAVAGVTAVEVTVHKPDAPIHHPFTDVRVVARRSRKSPEPRV
jgi:dihydroneopterin aldolase